MFPCHVNKLFSNFIPTLYVQLSENLIFLIAPTSDTANETDSMVQATDSTSGSDQQTPGEETTTVQEHQGTFRFRFLNFLIIIDTFYNYYGYFKGLVGLTWEKPVEVEPMQELEETSEIPKMENETVPQQPRLTRADKGEVKRPSLKAAYSTADHMDNALREFLAVVEATKQVQRMQCQKILDAYRTRNYRLKELLNEAEAAIYNNETLEVINGRMSGTYMVAYSSSGRFVTYDENKSYKLGRITFSTPKRDPIVVTAKCTKIMLHDKILKKAQSIDGKSSAFEKKKQRTQRRVPKIVWVNGVPGCGKTTWVVDNFDANKDVVATTTIEAAIDLRDRLVRRYGTRMKRRARTMASILVNGFSKPYQRLIVDEALMNHFGSIVMAGRLAGAKEIVLIGDVNQLPFLDRENLFPLTYVSPTVVASITKKLLCTYRNPMDIPFVLSDVYPGIYSSQQLVHSLKLKPYTGSEICGTSAKTLYLVHTQKEKYLLKSQGYGTGEGSRVLTIHEAQGLTCENVVIVNTKSSKLSVHESVPHAIVAVSRHTASCVYYSDQDDDAIARFAIRAMEASLLTIVGYNLRMAQEHQNKTVSSHLGTVIRYMTQAPAVQSKKPKRFRNNIVDIVFNTLIEIQSILLYLLKEYS